MRKNLLAKVIPYLIAERNALFNYRQCTFRLEKSKESTSRIVMYKEFDIVNSYTMESSFFGPKHPKQL